MSTAAAAHRGVGKGKTPTTTLPNGQDWGVRASFRSAPPRSTCMGNPWRPGQNATSTKVPLCTACDWLALQRHLILRACLHCSTIPPLPVQRIHHTSKVMGPHGEAFAQAGQQDHLVDEPADCRWLMTTPPLQVAKTRWIKCQPEPRQFAVSPAESYQTQTCGWDTEKGTVVDITLEWEQDLSCIRLKPFRTRSFRQPAPGQYSFKRRSEEYRKFARTKRAQITGAT